MFLARTDGRPGGKGRERVGWREGRKEGRERMGESESEREFSLLCSPTEELTTDRETEMNILGS